MLKVGPVASVLVGPFLSHRRLLRIMVGFMAQSGAPVDSVGVGFRRRLLEATWDGDKSDILTSSEWQRVTYAAKSPNLL